MTWSILKFGKHKGRTLPQVLFQDPDWFFWAVENDKFHSPTGKFAQLKLVPRSLPEHEGASESFRSDTINLLTPRQIYPFDKRGSKKLIGDLKYYFFGSSSYKMTKKRCEEFFEDDSNFVL